MAGFITLPDGRTWSASNGNFDRAILVLAASLPPDARDLAGWLMDTRSELRGPGLGNLDLRALTPAPRQLLLDAMEACFHTSSPNPPPDMWELDVFELLGHMVRAYRRGEPPGLLIPRRTGLAPPTDRREGPGWDRPADDEESCEQLAERFGVEPGALGRAAAAGRFRAHEWEGEWYATMYAAGRWLGRST